MNRIRAALGSSLLLVLCTTTPARVAAQSTASLPRDVVDSAFALKLAINEVQALIQDGTRPRTVARDTSLENAGQQLRLLRSAARRLAPTGHANLLWDFLIDVKDIRVVRPGEWIAYVTVSLSQDSISTAPLALDFRKTGGGWVLADKHDLLMTLHSMMSAQASRRTP